MPVTYGLNNGQTFLGEAGVDQQCRHMIFDTRPHLVGVGEWEFGSAAFGPRAEQEAVVIVLGIDALWIAVAEEFVLEVVFED